MIKFSLKCENKHQFDSWFGSNSDYERLLGRGLISCAVCGANKVEKAIMAPRVPSKNRTADPDTTDQPLSAPASAAEQAVKEMRKKIESEAVDVGTAFASEARKIHDGDAPERAIIGQAKPDEARALIEDGVPVVPLPWSNKPTN